MSEILSLLPEATSVAWRLDGFPNVETGLIDVPSNIADRSAQLAWLYDELDRLVGRLAAGGTVRVLQPGKGKFAASAERLETGGLGKLVAGRRQFSCEALDKDQIRARLGIARAKGATAAMVKNAPGPNETERVLHLLASLPTT